MTIIQTRLPFHFLNNISRPQTRVPPCRRAPARSQKLTGVSRLPRHFAQSTSAGPGCIALWRRSRRVQRSLRAGVSARAGHHPSRAAGASRPKQRSCTKKPRQSKNEFPHRKAKAALFLPDTTDIELRADDGVAMLKVLSVEHDGKNAARIVIAEPGRPHAEVKERRLVTGAHAAEPARRIHGEADVLVFLEIQEPAVLGTEIRAIQADVRE